MGKLTMPILAIGGARSFGATMAVVMRDAATDVKELIIPNSGHWLMRSSRSPPSPPYAPFSTNE